MPAGARFGEQLDERRVAALAAAPRLAPLGDRLDRRRPVVDLAPHTPSFTPWRGERIAIEYHEAHLILGSYKAAQRHPGGERRRFV